MNDPKVNFSKILDIVGYTGNKEELYNNMIGLFYINAVSRLIETLPQEQREAASKDLMGEPGEEQANNLRKYFNEGEITEALKKSSESIFTKYYEAIKPSLSEAQITQLGEYLDTVNPQTA